MIERIPKGVLVGGFGLGVLVLAYLAYSRPGYFTSETYLGGLIGLELLIAAVWMYRRVFFLVVIFSFLFAGVNLPGGGGVWTTGRWIVLVAGALIGLLIVVRDRTVSFGTLHILAFFTVLAMLVSTSVSQHPTYTLLKVSSMMLIFLYASTGARISVAGREDRFFRGLLIGCEVFVGANAFLYAVGIRAMGNPNSLGAVMSICAPILLWGALLGGTSAVQGRRFLLYAVCLYMVYISRARAGIMAALFASAFLCFALRRYKLLVEGTIALLILGSIVSLYEPEAISSTFSSVIYKSHPGEAILMSRVSPWQNALDSIQANPWFGIGLGTTSNEKVGELGMFTSSSVATAENGSSYLALLAGVGIVGAIPAVLVLLLIVGKIGRTVHWMWTTRSPLHPAIPIAMLLVAGFVHAAFEDWMFAAGNYMCVFFWSLAFILADVAPVSVPKEVAGPNRQAGLAPVAASPFLR